MELRLTNFLQAKAFLGRQLKSPRGGMGQVKKIFFLEESTIKAAERSRLSFQTRAQGDLG